MHYSEEMRKIIGLGETVYDIIFRENQPQRAVPGGSAFNSIVSLGRCGVPCVMVTEVGDDRVGDIVTAFLCENGVNTEYVYRHAGTQSHISLAFLNERNDAEYQFYKMHEALNMPPRFPEINEGDVVIFGSYFAINPKVRTCVSELLHKAHEVGAIIYYDINFRASHLKDLPQVLPSIIENMKLSTIVRGSHEDFSILFNEEDAKVVYEKHISHNCSTFIYTDADKPVQVFTPKYHSVVEAMKIDTVSTIGAGDNFNAGFCYGLLCKKIDTQAKIEKIDVSLMKELIGIGQKFSSAVCQSFDNYVSIEFGAQERKHNKLCV